MNFSIYTSITFPLFTRSCACEGVFINDAPDVTCYKESDFLVFLGFVSHACEIRIGNVYKRSDDKTGDYTFNDSSM